MGEARLGQCASAADGRHLIGILDQAQAPEGVVGGEQLQPGGLDRGPVGMRHGLRFGSQAASADLGRQRRHAGADASVGQPHLPAAALLPRLLEVARVHHDEGRFGGDEQRARPAAVMLLALLQDEARQPALGGGAADQQPVGIGGVQDGASAMQTVGGDARQLLHSALAFCWLASCSP